MIYHKQYKILPTATFKEELEDIIYYIMYLSNYIIIYEVKRNTRTSLCFTYILWYTKLF